METLEVTVGGGTRLVVDRWAPSQDPSAQGPPFVLLHGLASNARMWGAVAEILAGRGHPVVAVDQRGHGRSPAPGGPWDVATFADDVAGVIEALPGLAPAIAAGQSYGGNVVLELAARRPDLVRGVACVDGGWIELAGQFATWEECRDALSPPVTEGMAAARLEEKVRAARPGWPEEGIRAFLDSFDTRPDGTVTPRLARHAHLAVLEGLWRHRPSTLYPQVAVPVLLVPAGSERTPAGRGEGAARAAAALAQATLRPLEGDHDLHAERPGDVARVLHEWAASLPAAAPASTPAVDG